MGMPIDHKVGETVMITPETLAVIRHASHSIYATPSFAFVEKAAEICEKKAVGVITHRFRPGYEMTVDFGDGVAMHTADGRATLQLARERGTESPAGPVTKLSPRVRASGFQDAIAAIPLYLLTSGGQG